jgi:hypothetical protein
MIHRLLNKWFGSNVDARIVALVRGVIISGLLAAIAAVEAALADPSWSGYAWVPVAVLVLRALEGVMDNRDPTRPG